MVRDLQHGVGGRKVPALARPKSGSRFTLAAQGFANWRRRLCAAMLVAAHRTRWPCQEGIRWTSPRSGPSGSR
jgi:hypothetical protein